MTVFAQEMTPPPKAQTPTAGQKQATTEAVEKGAILGKVVSAADGTALKKANVTLFPQQSSPGDIIRPTTVTTDANGVFRFAEVVPGRYSITVSRNGYARQAFGQRVPNGPPSTITLLAGQTLNDITVRLLPAAAISGKIVDEDGEAVAGARVQLMRYVYVRGKRQLSPTGFSSTDDRGQFRIYGITAGRYYLSATYMPAESMMMTRPAGETGDAYAPTYYPGTNDVNQATPIVLRASEDQPGFNFRLLPGRAVRVSGTVRQSSGEPAKSAFVQLWPRGQMMMSANGFQSTDEKGNFTFVAVLPGSYSIFVSAAGSGDSRESARVELEVASEPVEGLLVQMGEGIDLEADIKLEGTVDLTKNTVRLMLQLEELVPMQVPMSEIKGPGTTMVRRVLDGNYRLILSNLPDDAYLKIAEYDGKDALAEGVKIRGGGEPLQIIISADGGHIEGNVTDRNKKPFSGAQVALVPEEAKRSRQDLYGGATTDQYGHFVLKGVTPGTYKLFAWEAIDSGAYRDPDFIKGYEDQGKSVTVSAGEHVTSDLTVILSSEKGQ